MNLRTNKQTKKVFMKPDGVGVQRLPETVLLVLAQPLWTEEVCKKKNHMTTAGNVSSQKKKPQK